MNSSILSFPRGPIFPAPDCSKTLATFWQEALADVSNRLGQAPAVAWLQAVRPLNVDVGVLTVAAPTLQIQDWISLHVASVVQETFRSLGFPDLRLRVVVDAEVAGEVADASRSRSFDSFAVSSENREAFFALRSILDDGDRPGVLISGPPGSGKTHLLMAAVFHASGQSRPVFVRTADAAEPDASASAASQIDGKPSLSVWDNLRLRGLPYREQERLAFELIHAQEGAGQIVLVTDAVVDTRSPMHFRLSEALHPLRSVSLSRQGYSLREATLKMMLVQQGSVLPTKVVQLLAALSPSDAHVMESVLRDIIELSRPASGRMEVQDVIRAVGRAGRKCVKTPPRAVLQTVIDSFGISIGALVGQSHNRQLEHARHVTMFLLRGECGISACEIGAILGGRSHSCVAYGCAEVDRHYSTVSGRQEIEALRRTLSSQWTTTQPSVT
jgi:chromosomal replication initiation ATPase DnaA